MVDLRDEGSAIHMDYSKDPIEIIEETRKELGEWGKKFTDEEILKIDQDLWTLAEIMVKTAMKMAREKNDPESIPQE